MENQKLNIQTLVAVVFIFLLVAAAVTTVFAQEQNTEKKDHTKIIQLKIVEDENGEVKSIDTTFVMDDDHDFDFDSYYNMNMSHVGDSMNFVFDFEGDNFRFADMDSLLKEITVDVEALDNGKMMMYITSDMDEAMEGFEKQMNSFTYSFDHNMSNCDSLIEVMVTQLDCNHDSMMKTHFQHMNIDSDEGKIFIYSDGEEVKIDDDGKVKVIKLGSGTGGNVWIGDTIIEDGNSKIIIKSTKGGDDMEQTIEYIISNEDAGVDIDKDVKVIKVKGDNSIWVDEDGEVHELDGENFEFESEDGNSGNHHKVKVIKKNGSKAVWINKENEIYEVDEAKYEFQTVSEKDLENLKNAGIKTKKKELQLENLKFSPNPSNGKFNLSFTLAEQKKVTINIYDINGNIVYTETLKDFQGEYNKEIDISQQESGTFFLQIAQGLYDIIKKIIIQ